MRLYIVFNRTITIIILICCLCGPIMKLLNAVAVTYTHVILIIIIKTRVIY